MRSNAEELTAEIAAPGTSGHRYVAVRAFTNYLCEPLETEDYVVQTMTDVSPTKWHLAHTTWFFETFVLNEFVENYTPFHPRYAYLFNSYYIQAGERHCRDKRGALTRPTVREIVAYRDYVDRHMVALLNERPDLFDRSPESVLEIGLNHEQQHQELLVTDIKHVFSVNPLKPVYRPRNDEPALSGSPASWCEFGEGIYEVGWNQAGFSYDNEGPRHRVYLQDFALADRLVTNGEFLEFMEDGGYRRPELWLSDGWAMADTEGWEAPAYWEKDDGGWRMFTLSGLRPIEAGEPVTHISYYEADAFARWAGHRLPTEFEWEVASESVPIEGAFVDGGRFHPAPAGPETGGLRQMYGEVWQWTQSHYSPYPGYTPPPGAIGEYNGKFMCNQFVLRGGSCATSASHIRRTYRNFFHAPARWQFTGIRLARG
jgi:ergothioneine biosynthesis protein EgtB